MSDLRYALFLGCTIPYRVAGYEVSARKVAERLGVELVDMPDFNCCGLPLDPVSHETTLTLSARDLCLAEQQGLKITTLCTGCAITLRKTGKMLKEDKRLGKLINEHLGKIGMELKETVEVKHFAHVLAEDVGLERIKGAVDKPLKSLKAAEHCGCHFLRPTKYAGFDDPENPKVLKSLIEATGAKCLDYRDETDCCGFTVIGIDEAVSLQLTRNKLRNVKEAGAQALVTICPSCFLMFDVQQPRIERAFNEEFKIPVLHYPQLLGLAMGMEPNELALKEHRVDAARVLNSLHNKT